MGSPIGHKAVFIISKLYFINLKEYVCKDSTLWLSIVSIKLFRDQIE